MVKVLLTGATGNIGGAILRSLLAHGHSVNSIVRDHAKGEVLAALGSQSTFTVIDFRAETVEQIATLGKDYDAFIHNAYVSPELEFSLSRAVIAVGRELEEQGKPFQFIFTSGCNSIGQTTEPKDESYTEDKPYYFVTWRNPLEAEVLAAGTDTFVTTMVRPVWVYPNSFVDQWAGSARTLGKVFVNPENLDSYVSLVALPDLGEQYNLLITHRAKGYFISSDNHPLQIRQLIEKVKEITGVTEEEHFTEPESVIPSVGIFAFALSHNQQIVTSRSLELGWNISQPNWLNAPQSF